MATVDIAALYEELTGEELVKVSKTEWHGKCLVHDDSKPSCHYNPEKGVFHCKSCDARGNHQHMVMRVHGLDKAGARKWLIEQKFMTEGDKSHRSWDNVDRLYSYTDASGETVLYEVARWDNPKAFGQRVPIGKNQWKYNLDGVTRVPYQWPLLAREVKRGNDVIFVPEGEKDVETLLALGLAATTSAQGANWEWPDEWAQYFAGAKTVVIIADNDEAGLKAAHQRANVVRQTVMDVRVIERMPGVAEKGDVTDWFAIAGNTEEKLRALVDATPEYVPAPIDDALGLVLNDMNDLGAGMWFSAKMRDSLRFIIDAREWVSFQGGVWVPKARERERAKHALDMLRDAAQLYAGPRAADLAEFAEKCRTRHTIDNVLKNAEQGEQLGMFADEFDTNPLLFNTPNGTLDLGDVGRDNTKLLRSHDPDDYIRLMSPVKFDPLAECPNFAGWLLGCCNGDRELFEYMQMLMGSCLEGRPGLRRMYFIYGPKGTGKSTFVRILEALLAEYQTSMDFATVAQSKFVNGGSARADEMDLKGRRAVFCSEVSEHARLDVAKIKQFIGGDSKTARGLYSKNIDKFKFEATLIMVGNNFPHIVADESFWDKFKTIPFTRPIEAEDPEFEARELYPELPGILNFALDGLRMLRARNYRIQDPAAVVALREKEMEAQDPFAEWAASSLEFVPGAEFRRDLAYENYCEWAVRTKAGYIQKKPAMTKWFKERHKIEPQGANANPYFVGVRPRAQPVREAPF